MKRKSQRLIVLFLAFMMGFTVSGFCTLKVKADEAAIVARPKVTLKVSGDSVTLTIKKTKNAEGYLIYARTKDTKTYNLIGNLEKNGSKKRKYTIDGLEDGTYYVKVKAYSGTVASKYSKVKKAVVNVDNSFYISEITDGIFERIKGKSFKDNCTVPREDLRYLHVLHKDLDGKTHEGEMIVNYHIAEDVLDILKQLYRADYPIEKMVLVDEYDADDEASMEDNNSSSFNFRFISHTTRVSKHGLGLAVDINTLYNPYTKVVDGERIIEPVTGEPYLDRDADFPYKIDENDLCYKLFIEKGFEWGGSWKDRKDYQHFEIATDVIAEWYPENV
jgi:hypothetical protein